MSVKNKKQNKSHSLYIERMAFYFGDQGSVIRARLTTVPLQPISAIAIVVGSRFAFDCFLIARSLELGACKLDPRDNGEIAKHADIYLHFFWRLIMGRLSRPRF